MIRPLEDKSNPGEYVNRVKKAEHDHKPGSRDFAYEVSEVNSEHHKGGQPPHDFGQDTYEPGDENSQPEVPDSAQPHNNESSSADESSLDITV